MSRRRQVKVQVEETAEVEFLDEAPVPPAFDPHDTAIIPPAELKALVRQTLPVLR